MANFIVFLDHEHAKVIEIHAEKSQILNLKRHEIRHHTGVEKAQNQQKDAAKFYDEVAGRLGQAHEILLVGPGFAKTTFKTHLEAHHRDTLLKKIVGIETVDHPTDGQLVALAKKFFKAHLAFE